MGTWEKASGFKETHKFGVLFCHRKLMWCLLVAKNNI